MDNRTKEKKYKVSMFTICVNTSSGGMILYNSLKGTKSILMFEDASEVSKWLQSDREYEACDSNIFNRLIEYGYLIDAVVDEKAVRDSQKAKLMENRCLNLTIYVTEKCNFRCIYCPNGYEDETIDIEVRDNLVNYIKRNIHRYSGIYVSWFGGEPLLEMSVIEEVSKQIMLICARNKKPYYADVTTNGYLLTPENMKRLIDLKIREFCVTVDGNEKIHDKMRRLAGGGLTYSIIIDNLKYIKKSISAKNVEIAIRVNVTKETVDEFPNIYRYFDTEFGDDERFSLYVKVVRNWGGERIKEIDENIIEESEISVIYGKYLEIMNNIKIKGCFERLEFGGLSCVAMRRNSFTIFPDGSISKCEKRVDNNIIGYLHDNGIKYDDMLAENWNGIAYRLSEKCDACKLSPLCFGAVCPRDKIMKKKSSCEKEFEIVSDLIRFYVEYVERRKHERD